MAYPCHFRGRTFRPVGRGWKTTVGMSACHSRRDRVEMRQKLSVSCGTCSDFPALPIRQCWTIPVRGASLIRRLRRPDGHKGRGALHPHDHRPRRPRARPDLRLRHHGLCRRTMGPALDHHRHVARRAGARPRAHHGRTLSLLPARRLPRGSAQGSRGHAAPPPKDAPTHGHIRQGFVYERVPHITLKSIANNAEIDVIWEKWQATLEPLRASTPPSRPRDAVSRHTGGREGERVDFDAPVDAPTLPSRGRHRDAWRNGKSRASRADWPEPQELHADWWEARIARQKEIDASIAAKAEFEYLYDRPYEDNAAGPRRRPVHGREPVAAPRARRRRGRRADRRAVARSRGRRRRRGADFAQMMLENCDRRRAAGAQGGPHRLHLAHAAGPASSSAPRAAIMEGETRAPRRDPHRP